MLTARIQSNNKETLVHFPCTKRVLASKLSRIGIQTPASKLPCETTPESEVKIALSADELIIYKTGCLHSVSWIRSNVYRSLYDKILF